MNLLDIIKKIESYYKNNIGITKSKLSKNVAELLSLKKERSVYVGNNFALRFSSSSVRSFSNAIVSLATLQKYDHIPFVVVIVKLCDIEFLLSNSTFLKKISHSSHQLRVDNIKGSFLGHDILRKFRDIENIPCNFKTLFDIHQGYTWSENLDRLVLATSNIVSTGNKFAPTQSELDSIYKSPVLANSLICSYSYIKLRTKLYNLIKKKEMKILELANNDNVNLRGNYIEQEITGRNNEHNLADMINIVNGVQLLIEIKTKIIGKSSNPKAYNVDKLLAELSKGNVVFSLLFIGIDLDNLITIPSLVSVFDKTIIKSTIIRSHFAGRNSRGTAQFQGEFTNVINHNYAEIIEESDAIDFLRQLVDM